MRNQNPGELPGAVLRRAKSAPDSPRPPGRPDRPAALARPASWPGCDPYRPRRRDQPQRLIRVGNPLITLLHRVLARAGAALLRLVLALIGGRVRLAPNTIGRRPAPTAAAVAQPELAVPVRWR